MHYYAIGQYKYMNCHPKYSGSAMSEAPTLGLYGQNTRTFLLGILFIR